MRMPRDGPHWPLNGPGPDSFVSNLAARRMTRRLSAPRTWPAPYRPRFGSRERTQASPDNLRVAVPQCPPVRRALPASARVPACGGQPKRGMRVGFPVANVGNPAIISQPADPTGRSSGDAFVGPGGLSRTIVNTPASCSRSSLTSGKNRDAVWRRSQAQCTG
jgi:hypothetical protein